MTIPEEQRFTEAEFKKLSAGQREHYANLTGQDRLDYVAARRSGQVLPETKQVGSSTMRGYGKVGTLAFACVLALGILIAVTSEQPSQPALITTLLGAGGISICAFAWMLGAIEARIITLTAVMRSRS